jgi:hypothetical protein
MKVLYASLVARTMPRDGCAHCKRTLRELEAENARLLNELERLKQARSG